LVLRRELNHDVRGPRVNNRLHPRGIRRGDENFSVNYNIYTACGEERCGDVLYL
jgi:hypothetical protein